MDNGQGLMPQNYQRRVTRHIVELGHLNKHWELLTIPQNLPILRRVRLLVEGVQNPIL